MKIFGIDVANTYACKVSDMIRPKIDSNFYSKMVSADELRKASSNTELELSPNALNMVEKQNVHACCVFDSSLDKVVGYNYFATGVIDPSFNKGAYPFVGTGVVLPKNIVYMFRGFTLPKYRGIHLLSDVLVTGCEQIVGRDGWSFATADVKNKSADKLILNTGLKRHVKLREYWFVNKSHHAYPENFQLSDKANGGNHPVGFFKPNANNYAN